MAEFRCPAEIDALFDDVATTSEGRRRAAEWAAKLELKPGDNVWLPEIGWCEKGDGRIQ